MIRRKDVLEIIGLGRTQLDCMVKADEFPKPIKIWGRGRAVAWFKDEIVKWQKDRVAAAETEVRDAGAEARKAAAKARDAAKKAKSRAEKVAGDEA
jgi:predicted DNA-binding transcriptional regulator AlpA